MMGSDSTWVGRKPMRRLGGMSDALSIAAELGFSVPPPPSQEEIQNLSTTTGENGDDLIRVLKELTAVQRKIADLQVELQGRKEDKNVAHLTHVSEMEKKIETLQRITTILKDVIQNKSLETQIWSPEMVEIRRYPYRWPENDQDRIIARLQQPYSLDCIPVEAEYQKQFSELLMRAASDYGALTASVTDFQWSQNFKEPPTVWGEMLRPIPVALASSTRFFEAMSAMRESIATLHALRVGHSSSLSTTPSDDPSQRTLGDSDCVTPPPWRTESSFDDLAVGSLRRQESEPQEGCEVAKGDSMSHRRLSWPPSVKNI
ncbi:AUGMIN subunit 2 [Datura stramonium]|uniref:AUGMIN subunit 2 n=1 Tax=Datura stramonium TaxID=4076 RepID=A0ABS8SCM3_DATST|nr:AUGMIN subunit 2 [Datura stramonium]